MCSGTHLLPELADARRALDAATHRCAALERTVDEAARREEVDMPRLAFPFAVSPVVSRLSVPLMRLSMDGSAPMRALRARLHSVGPKDLTVGPAEAQSDVSSRFHLAVRLGVAAT